MKISNTLAELILLVVYSITTTTDAACTFPSELTDIWYSAHKGALTFNNTHITGYPIYMSVAVQSLDFGCHENDGHYYLLKASKTAFIFGNNIRAYLCIELYRISEYKYYYYMGTTVDPTNNDNIKGVVDGMTVNMNDTCNRATPYEAGTYIVLVKKGAPASGMAEATCSSPLLAKYSIVQMTDTYSRTCSGTKFDGCSITTGQTYTYNTGCIMQYSNGGKYVCLRSVSSGGYYYLSVWNNDTKVPTTGYQFSCLVVSASGSTAYATEIPNYCSYPNQTSQALETGTTNGNFYVFTNQTETCETKVEGQSSIVFYATIVIGALTIIGLVVLIVFLLKTRGCPECCRKPCSCCRPCSFRCPSCVCCKCQSCKRSNKVGVTLDSESAPYMHEETRPDEVANIIFRLPPIDAFKPKRPIPLGPIVEASIMPLPKVEPLYARLPEIKRNNELKRSPSIGSIFSFRMKF